MAEIAALLEIFLRGEEDDAAAAAAKKPPRERARTLLRSDPARSALCRLLAVLHAGISSRPDAGDQIGLQSWTRPQIEAVVGVVTLVVPAVLPASADHADPVLLAIVAKSIEFCICFLETSDFDDDDFSLQDKAARFFELALLESVSKDHSSMHRDSLNSFVTQLSVIPVDIENPDFGSAAPCDHQAMDYLRSINLSERLQTTLPTDYGQPGSRLSWFTSSQDPQCSDGIITPAQYLAVVRLKCFPRLLGLCKRLIVIASSMDKLIDDANVSLRLSFSQRILNVLLSLARMVPHNACDVDLLCSVAGYMETFPALFMLKSDFLSNDSSTKGVKHGSLLLQILEEFLQFIQICFSDTIIFSNVQASIVASMMSTLDSKVWRYDGSSSSLKIPIIYCPRFVLFVLKLLRDAKTWVHQIHDFKVDSICFSDHYESNEPSCCIGGEKVSLIQKRTSEEYFKLMFPPSMQWVDNLIHLAYFLHLEGVKYSASIENSRVCSMKPANIPDSDCTSSHEDEAIFGNLFSETCRQLGSTDGLEQPTAAVTNISGDSDLLIQAATEVLVFLKVYIFSSEWSHLLFEDACRKIGAGQIDQLLMILNCNTCSSGERNSMSSSISHSRLAPHINESCFELLCSLVSHHVLSNSLTNHLVDQVLKIEDGIFIYNDHTLSLLAHALVLRDDLGSNTLIMKIYEGYVSFILEKAERNCSESADVYRSLPSSFHLEILLMSFHLSNDADKVSITNFVFSSLRRVAEIPRTEFGTTQLFCWALYVSRLILIWRHTILHPSACPSWLLSQFRSRLRKIPPQSRGLLPSWTSTVVGGMLKTSVRANPTCNVLLSHLVDVVLHPSPSSIDVSAIQRIGLNYHDLVSTFSNVLDLWNGRKAEAIEHLILERYLYSLCWDTVSTLFHGPQFTPLQGYNLQNLDLLDTRSFYNFLWDLIIRGADIHKDAGFPELICNLLKQLQEGLSVQGWDFLRKSSWLCLIVSLLHAGLSRYYATNVAHEEQPFLLKHPNSDGLVSVGENIILSMFEQNQDTWLLSVLSSILKILLQFLDRSFVCMFEDDRSSGDVCSPVCSPLILLKHSHIDKSNQNILIEKYGCNISQLESIYGVLLKLDFVSMQSTESTGDIIARCLLHGFPSNQDSCDGTLLSCALNIRDIIYVFGEYLKVKYTRGEVLIEDETVSQLLESLKRIRSDKIFQEMHERCDAIFNDLIGQREYTGYLDVLAVKQLESFLADMNSGNIEDIVIKEMVIDTLVDSIQGFLRDSSKAQSFQFYLGSDKDVPEKCKEFFDQQCGNLLVLINALDQCHSEMVNLKVINLFVDLLSGGLYSNLREKLQKKFLDMDMSCLSNWLEKRLLGNITEASGSVTVNNSSKPLRESTMGFISCLVSQPCELLSRELRSRFIEAMLMSLDRAFIYCDIQSAKAYFNFIVQLLNGEPSMKQLLERTVLLMDKMSGNESLLNGLKFLLGFLGCVIGDFGANNTSDKISSKADLCNNTGHGLVVSKSVNSRKNPENLVLPSDRESGAASIDCDATSADDDEDDGTSDGELGSVDKDDEEESSTERALASKVCTFTSSGSNFMEQHWYFCYTCDLTVSKGCCSVCAKVCHRGHRVVYSRSSRFFCDCGAGGVRGSSCQCLKPRKVTGSNTPPADSTNNLQSLLPLSTDGEQPADSDSDLDDDICMDTDNCFKLSIPKKVQDELPSILINLGFESRLLEVCNKLLPVVISQRESNLSKDNDVILGNPKQLCYSTDLFQLKRAYKSGSLDLKIKADYPNSRELKSLLACGSLTKSLLTVSARGRLAAGEGDKVTIFDVGQLIGQPTVAPVTADKTNVKPLSKNIVRFEIVHLVFNPVVENFLAVSGFEDCQVLTVNPRGEVTDRLAVELALQGAYIRRVDWVPGSQVQLMVVTNMFVKVYDLSQDNISPMHYFTLSDDMIADAILVPASMGKAFLLVLSESGRLYRLEMSMEGDVGAKVLTDVIRVHEKDIHSKGLSLCFSSTYRLVILSYQDGTTLMGRLDANVTSLVEVSYIYEADQDGKLRPAALHHWKELLSGSGLFVCLSDLKSNAALSISLGSHEVFAQNMRYGAGSSMPLVGIASYKPLSKDKVHCLVLQDDGSLQIYSHVPVGADTAAITNVDQTRKLGSNILNNRAYAGASPEFPLDFFERTMCITGDVKFSSDAIKNVDSEVIKQKMTSDEGFLESPSATGFKVTVSNSNNDIVMVGCRVHVGNTSATHIPSEVKIFQRVVKLDEGLRSWYDIPFTVAESLLADEEFTIAIGQTFDGSAMPRIDSLEVYGRAKDEFGWKEKMDAVLDMEAHALGRSSASTGAGKKYQNMQAAPIQEQVLSDAIKLLSKIYSSCRSHYATETEDVDLDLNKLKSRTLLEAIFQSDRGALLHSAACHVLQSVFPKKETYYRVKDTMRLMGVVSSVPIILSRTGVGGAAAGWVIKEFSSQMQAVTKIALHRRANMAAFLESHGSDVVDGLMQVLWGILDLERPETQTVNSIVVPAVELIYSYAECLALHGTEPRSVAPAVTLLKRLLFAPYEAVQTSSSLAISSRLLQVPFPKQTMLTTDDISENSATHGPSDTNTTGVNAHGMIEEDSTVASVQYCCDGCSTVPILRRRWHCNVCPDFDLCEACYEVLDADRLPQPHSRDHPMSAIPIEMDTLGGESNEIHFPIDELGDPSLMQVAADISMQNSSSSSIHILETSESGDFPGPVTDRTVVSLSASQRTLNSLLLRHLIGELKGWMESTSGFRAISIMQLFYRLSSAVGGPLMDSSKPENLDLEKFVKWLLDEINLNRSFPAKTRSSFGEVAILVFMFFTLMLRNWHQPGGESSQSKSGGSVDLQDKAGVKVPLSASAAPSSSDDPEKTEFATQLIRACSILRQQTFLNYLMEILQQLVNIFKSSSGDNEGNVSGVSSCGSLLSVRRELPAGNFSPFFSDSYAKSHRADIFIDYHKLLLENTFRLVYSLVRPEKHDKLAEKDKSYNTCTASKDLKLDGFQDVLCSYISNPHTSFVRRYARRLLLHLCGSKTQYYSIRDSWQFSNEINKLNKLVNKSGGFQNPVPYERSVKLVKCLSSMAEVAGARPRNWQKCCLKHVDLLSFLMSGIFYFGEESVVQTLKLLNLAFYTGKDMSHSANKMEGGDAGSNTTRGGLVSSNAKKKRRGEDGMDNSSEKICDMEQAVDVFTKKDGSVLRNFIDNFLLEWNSSSVRQEVKGVLYGIWHHGRHSFKEVLLTALLQKVKQLPTYGQNITEYTELMMWLLGKVSESSTKQYETEIISRCLSTDVISCICETLHSQNELLANHPNSHIYNTLSGLVEFDGYYLESEPCVSCSCPEVPYSRMKLESLKSETKFTDNRIIVKCTGSYTIQSVTMNVHDARRSKSVKVLNLYYNNRPVADLSELKNNWSLWKRAKSCHLVCNQTELKVEFPIPITACNFMIELDSFYENLQASSLESLQCPRCSRSVTDKHGICSNCHENAYQCRQCRNINYENLDSFLCNECGYSKYGRFEFNFMAKPSFLFDNMENDEDMKKGLAAIESESENAHRRYQQLLGFKKPLLKLVSSIGENEIDNQQKDSVQQMMVSLPGPSCKINRKIALLGVLYGEKCKAAFDSVSKSVQTLQGLRRVLLTYLQHKNSDNATGHVMPIVARTPNNCYGCATTFVTQCLELLQMLSKHAICKRQLVAAGILTELFENNIHQGPKTARLQARAVLCSLSEGDADAVSELNNLIQKKVMYCLEHHRSMDIALATREELLLLSETCMLVDEYWEARLRVAFQLLFSSIKLGAKHPSISEHIILPCLRIISQACTPPRSNAGDKEQDKAKSSILHPKNDRSTKPSVMSNCPPSKVSSESSDRQWEGVKKGQDIPLLSYSEWEKGASYIDFVRRQYKVTQAVKGVTQRVRQDTLKNDYLALKYALKWKRHTCRKTTKSDFTKFALGSWVSELILSACSQSIRSEVCNLVTLLCPQSSTRQFQLLNLLMSLLPATLSVGECAAEYFELFFKMVDSEAARLYLTVRGCLATICRLITQEVCNVESQERSLSIDISRGFTLHKLIELLNKFLELPNIRVRFMQNELLSEVLEALLVIRGLVVQKTKLIGDCNRRLKELLDGLLLESTANKRQFIRACISGLQNHSKERKGRTSLFILEQLCNIICPSKPEPVYLLILNKAHTQEEFIRGSMTKNPYSSIEIGPLMRDVKNKICHQLDLLGLLEDDYGMELLVAGNIISLDLSISQVYEQVWKKYHNQNQSSMPSTNPASTGLSSSRECPPMTVTYRLQGLDGEATEPMIKELEEEREESQDPEVEFAIAGAVRECGGLEVLLSMIQRLCDDELKSNQEELGSTLNLLMYCCKIQENRRALLQLGALGLLLETARRAFSVDAMEPAEGILLIVESLTMEANESDVGINQSVLTITNEESGSGEQAKKIVLMFLDRLCHPMGIKKSSKQQRNKEMVARILPYLTYGEPAAMETLIHHFYPYLQDWCAFDRLHQRHHDDPKDEVLAQEVAKQRSALENFVRVSESLKTSSCGERLKDIILEKGITSIAVKYLRETFAIVGQTGFKTNAEWISGLKLPSVPLILSMLRGLSKGHLPTQKCIDDEGILPVLHALEGVPGENEIGARAENLLDTLADKEKNGDGFLGEKINKLRHATKDEMRRRALRKREELLQGLGMRQEYAVDGGERIVVAQPVIEGLEDVEEEEGVACMVCREGYTLRPNDMLGVYSYSKRVNLGSANSASGRGDCVYTTVSHFNIIHFQCHQEAKRADAALKNPKKEWEGATLRNNETLCNCIFPLRGPCVPLAHYARCVDQYWDNLSALGRADGSRLRLLTYDIVLMLARFATGASFSTDSKGGGRESNSRFLPFMIQMASYLLDQGSSNQPRHALAKSVTAYLSNGTSTSDSPSRPSSGARTSLSSDETVQFMMVNSLLSESYEDWLQHRPAFLQRGIYHAYMQHKHGRSTLRLSSDSAAAVVARSDEGSSTDLTDSGKLFAIVQPMLIYTGLIEQLQRLFKPSKGTGGSMSKESVGDSVSISSSGVERWEVVMKERMVNMKEMVSFSRDLLSWLEDMTSSADLQEAFDVMGALGDALSGGISSCEDFVRAAIHAGKC